MTAPDPDVHNTTEYLCVDAFIGDMTGARALATAFELGLIDYIEQNHDAAFVDMRERFKADERGLQLLLNLLRANHVIAENNGRFNFTPQFRKALQYRDLMEAKLDFANGVVPDFTDYFTALISRPDWFLRNARVFDLFSYNRCFDPTPENNKKTRRWMRITTLLTRYESLACMHHHDFSSYQRMLDIGGNSGEFVLQICRKHPGISATVFDLPLVCDIGADHIRSEPEADRITFVKGDALTDPLPKNSDLISFKSMLHDWPDAEAGRLIVNAGRALNAGGTLLIFERGPIEVADETVPYSMIPFLLFFRSYRFPEFYEKILKRMNFHDITVKKIILQTPFHLVTAKK